MKLEKFLKNINDLIEKNPEILKMDVISAIDDEGNGYNGLHFNPSVGMFNDDEEFHSCEEDFREWVDYCEDDESTEWKPNAICIN